MFGTHKDDLWIKNHHNNHDNLCILFDMTEIRRLKTCRISVELCDEACRKTGQRRKKTNLDDEFPSHKIHCIKCDELNSTEIRRLNQA